MYVITNRHLRTRRNGLEIFSDKPNRDKGPNELRVLRCTLGANDWSVDVLPDKVTGVRRKELKDKLGLPRSNSRPIFTSLDVADQMITNARDEGKNVVLFVHGYNTNIEAALKTAQGLADNYNVMPLLFSWPSNGGGVRGLASYLSDKRDAMMSVSAFARTLQKINELMNRYTLLALDYLRPELENLATNVPAGGHEYHHERNRLLRDYCNVRLTLMTHSMGNYLLKKTMESQANAVFTNSFDNIVLASADVNNKDHAHWVDRLDSRRRTYITINEDDFALTASRIKPGEKQLARLGHYLKRLDSRTARYVDFTDTDKVGNSHGYFGGEGIKNPEVKRFFRAVLNGKEAETGLVYESSEGVYRVSGNRTLSGPF